MFGQTATYFSAGYDVGTEINTEDFADMVPLCQELVGVSSDDDGPGMSDPKLAENSVIKLHTGIKGDADLQAVVHGWVDPTIRSSSSAPPS